MALLKIFGTKPDEVRYYHSFNDVDTYMHLLPLIYKDKPTKVFITWDKEREKYKITTQFL